MDPPTNFSMHPCFDIKARHLFGRIHLPVAPRCNVQCHYCNRKFDCANESRPGVTSAVLSPGQALHYLNAVLEKETRITVVGIAGPGDPFANPEETMETLRLVRRDHKDMLLCIASNGLGIGPYIDELAELQTSHVTITINAVDPEVGQRIYGYLRDQKIIYRGLQAAEILLKRQQEAVLRLKEHGITVKVNSIIIPGINDTHIPAVAQTVAGWGADIMNCIPLFPTAGTLFANLPEPDGKMTVRTRLMARESLPQMTHCTRCRADAVGMLGASRTEEFRPLLEESAKLPLRPGDDRPFVAVASLEGALVNQHLGEAEQFRIFDETGGEYRLVESRTAPPPGCGDDRWLALARLLLDCRAVLISAVGGRPREVLEGHGIRVIEMAGMITDGLDVVYKGADPRPLQKRHGGGCTGGRGGSGCG
ncbi:MAG: radical SAM protein [Capsulimonadaceae bacterium]